MMCIVEQAGLEPSALRYRAPRSTNCDRSSDCATDFETGPKKADLKEEKKGNGRKAW